MDVKNNLLYGCMRCVIYGSSRDTTLIGSYNCSAVNTSGLVAVNCSAMVFDSTMNGRTYVNNGRVLKNGWTTITNSIASALQPYVTFFNEGNKFKVDTSGGDVNLTVSIEALKGEEIILKVVDATNNIVINTVDGSGNYFDTTSNAVPYTISPSVGDTIRISSDGTNLYQI